MHVLPDLSRAHTRGLARSLAHTQTRTRTFASATTRCRQRSLRKNVGAHNTNAQTPNTAHTRTHIKSCKNAHIAGERPRRLLRNAQIGRPSLSTEP